MIEATRMKDSTTVRILVDPHWLRDVMTLITLGRYDAQRAGNESLAETGRLTEEEFERVLRT